MDKSTLGSDGLRFGEAVKDGDIMGTDQQQAGIGIVSLKSKVVLAGPERFLELVEERKKANLPYSVINPVRFLPTLPAEAKTDSKPQQEGSGLAPARTPEQKSVEDSAEFPKAEALGENAVPKASVGGVPEVDFSAKMPEMATKEEAASGPGFRPSSSGYLSEGQSQQLEDRVGTYPDGTGTPAKERNFTRNT